MTWYRRVGDRRGRLRFELVGELAAVLGTTDVFAALDVSELGALVESAVPLPVDSVHSLRFVRGVLVDELTVRVRHVTPTANGSGGGRYRIGLEFLELPTELRSHLHRLAGNGSSGATEM
jgi:hypothetical protein